MINILHYIPSFQVGGIESFLLSMDKYREADINFIYLVENEIPEEYSKIIKGYGSKIIYLSYPGYKSFFKILKYIKSLKKILVENKIDILHCHVWSSRPFIIPIALLSKIKIRIVHSHSKNFNSNNKYLLQKLFTKFGVALSNVYYGCSEDACKFAFNRRKYTVINNGIDFEKFKYNKVEREKVRAKNNIQFNQKVYINVGRFCYLKNQVFLIDVFYEILKYDKDAILFLVGSGDDIALINKKIEDYGIIDNVIIFDSINNPASLLSAADCFIFPSISEGLGISYLEAQAAGLKCIISNGVPNIGTFSTEVIQLDLDQGPEKWASNIISFMEKKYVRKSFYSKKFDSKEISKKYQENVRKLVNL